MPDDVLLLSQVNKNCKAERNTRSTAAEAEERAGWGFLLAGRGSCVEPVFMNIGCKFYFPVNLLGILLTTFL